MGDPGYSWSIVIGTIVVLSLIWGRPRRVRASPNVPGSRPTMATTVVRTRAAYPSMPAARVARGASNAQLTFELGVDAGGVKREANLAEMPHLLVAGATGSGKSVFVRSMLSDLIERYPPDEVRLVLIDPKRVELVDFKSAPHCQAFVYEVEDAIKLLQFLCDEMERRYAALSMLGARSIDEVTGMSRVVVVVEELANLMLARGRKAEVETLIIRLASMARAVGVHLVLVTQRPSVDVVTGIIKANVPARVCMSMPSSVDSRVVLGVNGAETLRGNGDMLVVLPGVRGTVRLQGRMVTPAETRSVVGRWA